MKYWNLAWCLCLLACGGNSERASALSNGCAIAASNQWLSGQVSAVIDGDTLVLNTGNSSEHIRLQGIDAPELTQTEGAQAKQALSALALHQSVRLAYSQRDRYGRILGQVFNNNCNDLNKLMLQAGMAWFYKAYACDLESERRQQYAAAESHARTQGLGLWAKPQPVAPWVFRNGEDPAVPVCAD
jgi:micrococcal nuclease